MEFAGQEMERIVAAQRVKIATTTRTKSADAFSVPPGDDVLVLREKSKKWGGPYKLHKYDNYKTVYVKVGNGVEPFSTTTVKPYLTEENDEVEGILRNEATRTLPHVNERVEVYWPKYEKYYPGTIVSIDDKSKKRHILYDDGDEEILDFSKEK